jgi:arylsulfatase A-like enzyme
MKTIVFVFDSLRMDHISSYGYSRKTTPNMDMIASDGVVFEQAFSQAIWTTPSSGSILTGRYPMAHRRLSWENQIADSAETVAAPFQEAGVHTCAISTMATVSEQGGYDEGFDEFIELFNERPPTDPATPKAVMDRVIQWLKANAERDFLLFVWSSGTHTPYQTPNHDAFVPEDNQELGAIPELKSAASEQTDLVRDLYDNTIHYNDAQFGRIVESLKSLDIYDETLLALLSDHGEIFDEYARLEHTVPVADRLLERIVPDGVKKRNNLFYPSGWLGHQAVLPYDELLHVPMIIKFPEGNYACTRVKSLVQNIDIGPTLIDYLLDDSWASAQGQSLLPTLDGQTVNDYVYSTSSVIGGDVLYHSIRDDEFKYVRLTGKRPSWANLRRLPRRAIGSQLLRFVADSELLFSVPEGESKNLLANDESIDKKYRNAFQTWMDFNQDIAQKDETHSGRLDETTEDRLRELGYLE